MIKPQKFLDLNDIYKADLKDIYQAAQVLFAPSDMLHFNKLLYTACKYYGVIMRYDTDFARARISLYLLRQKFRERYDFLVEGALRMQRKDALPSFNFKQGGLFETWLLFTPEQIRESFQQILQKKRYESLTEFLDAYFEVVEDTYASQSC